MADKMVQPHKDEKPVSGETKAAMVSGGESQGNTGPAETTDKKPGFHGGQTEQGYHGSGQLGDQKVGDGKQNATSTSENSKGS
jgi:hypothetical protein